MERDSTASTKTARALLWAVFGTNVYRAATQSITTDEAFTYSHFVHPRWSALLGSYDANNHVLNTLLAKIGLTALPLTEFALRLPSLLCGGLYLWAVWRLARRTFGNGALFLAAVALLALNPLVLDYLSAARGYGMALALWTWALNFMLEYLAPPPAGGREDALNLAGLCLGLSLAANLSFAYPAVALAAVFWVTLARRKQAPAILVAERFLATAIGAAFLLLALPMAHAEAGNFYFGAHTLRDTFRSLVVLSFYHTRLLSVLPRPFEAVEFLEPVLRIGMGLLAAAALAGAIRILKTGKPGTGPTLLVLTGGSMALTFLFLVIAHRGFGIPYPLNRTALYFIPLPALAALALAAHLNWKPATAAAIFLSALLCGQYLLQADVRLYGEWRGEAESKALVQALMDDAGRRSIRIAASDSEEPVLNFYRERYRLRNWAPVERKTSGDYDYFVLSGTDLGLLGQRRFRVVYRDLYLALAQPSHD